MKDFIINVVIELLYYRFIVNNHRRITFYVILIRIIDVINND